MLPAFENHECCFCDADFGRWGHNPAPLMDGSKNACCDECNYTKVLPARLYGMPKPKKTEDDEKPKEVVVEKTKDGEFVRTYPLKSGDGDVVDDIKEVEMDGEIVLSGHDAFHPDVMIRTTRKEIDDCMSEIDTNTKAKHCFRQSWDRIKVVNTDALFVEGGEKWKDFLEDIVCYYCARFKLFDKPMPAVFSPEMEKMCAKIGKGDAQVDMKKETIVSKK